MSDGQRTDDEIINDFLKRMGHDQSLNQLVTMLEGLVKVTWLQPALKMIGLDRNQVMNLLQQRKEILEETAFSLGVLTPLGWAPSGSISTSAVRAALDEYRDSKDLDRVEKAFLIHWNKESLFRLALQRVKTIGSGWEPLNGLSRRRWILLSTAMDHHFKREYVASVPIVLAQIDGLVQDVTENQSRFFSKADQRTSFEDISTVAGMKEGLSTLRCLFSEDQKQTASSGSLSRHGIMHGRELGYDNEINSTKVFTLLFAVVEWAQPVSQRLVKRYKAEEEQRWMGSNAIDESGRRRDQREFIVTRETLREVYFGQHNALRQHSLYLSDLQQVLRLGTPYPRIKFLDDKSRIHLSVDDEKSSWWAWTATISGFCFGIAATREEPEQWYYAGEAPPLGGVNEDDRWVYDRSSKPKPLDWFP